MQTTAIVLTNGDLLTVHGKTAHGLLRGSSRFAILGVVDHLHAGKDAGELLDGVRRGIPVFGSIRDALAGLGARPEFCVVGVATHGGRLVAPLRTLLKEALAAGMSVVNGLHEYASDDPDLAALARRDGAAIIDVRKPKPTCELHFWSGAILQCATPRIAVLGMDCAIGKRTTAHLLVEACNAAGIAAEMLYTGQTGWMQGADYGCVLDSLPNDFVAGEIEHAILSCVRDRNPDLIVIEGQSSLSNPCGPCGAELLLSGGARGVVLQHAPGRRCFEGYEERTCAIPPIAREIELIGMYGAEVLAVTLNRQGLDAAGLAAARERLRRELRLPVIDPLAAIDELLPIVRDYLAGGAARRAGTRP
ncbi:MAG TPA: DUF1611 domain-containing protein [Planctomycetes bacterium]|nr:DUF1611 domain-containing protein [Planctomycetota bacterium]